MVLFHFMQSRWSLPVSGKQSDVHFVGQLSAAPSLKARLTGALLSSSCAQRTHLCFLSQGEHREEVPVH